MNRILVIRGGAIGDFILTLPALKALRDGFPQARIELLGYKHIALLAENRFYAEAVRSIEYGPLSGFFARGATLDPALRDYFGSFDLIVSYLFDPDGIFEANLRRCGVKDIVIGPAKIAPPSVRAGLALGYGAAGNESHAVRQLLWPIRELELQATDFAPRFYPSAQDRQLAEEFLKDLPGPIIAIHPGSGSETKNWPIENWIEFGDDLLGKSVSLLVVGGEADGARIKRLETEWKTNSRVRFARSLSLPQLGAMLENRVFVGHDSGISHLAAAAGAKCVLLFGPTDPAVWAPLNQGVIVLRPATRQVGDVNTKDVLAAVPF